MTKDVINETLKPGLDWRTLVGLSDVFSGLNQFISSGRIHPVILLHGPDGVGKRNVAVWLAAKFLCRSGAACGECGPCREILAGIHPDLLLIDEPDESVLKTSVLEDLQRNLDILSAEGVRVAIITDCDRMTREAANRMLKTLEEPPEHVRIILTTSRPRALLPTVLGRCLRWHVQPPHEEILLPWLKQELARRGRTAESDDFYRQWLKRMGCCPGLVLRELDDLNDRGAAISSRMRSIIWARSASEVLRAADDLIRTTKATMSEILSAAEWELNQKYHSSAPVITDAGTTLKRRRILRTLRRLSVRGKVHLNTQLAAESIGLAAFTSDLGDSSWHS